MSLVSLVNIKGLALDALTPFGGGFAQRDPFAPNFELIIYGGKGAFPVAVSDELKAFIDTVEYEDNADQFDKLTIVMRQADNFGGGEINGMIDSKLFSEGTIVEVQMGYGNSLFTVGAASIVTLEPDFPQDGPPTLTIIGYDLLHKASRRKPKGGVSYKGFRDSQIASIIGSRNDFDIKINTPASFSGITKVPKIEDRVQKKGVSDYVFLKKVADINGFDLYSKFDPDRKKFGLFFGPAPTSNNKEVFLFTYNEGGVAYGETLLSFKPKLEAQDQATDFEVFVLKNKLSSKTSFKPMDRLTIAENLAFKGATERRYTGGNIGVNGGKKTPNSDGIEVAFKAFGRSFQFPKHKRFKDEASAKKSIEQFIKRQKENFITGEGKLIGNEVLQSRQIHTLEGISDQFSGKYYFTRVLHKMSKSEGGYFNEFSARKVIKDTTVQAPPTLNLTANDKKFRKLRE